MALVLRYVCRPKPGSCHNTSRHRLRRSTGFARGDKLAWSTLLHSNCLVIFSKPLDVNYGPLSVRHTLGYPKRKKYLRFKVYAIIFVVAVPYGYASTHRLQQSVATKIRFPMRRAWVWPHKIYVHDFPRALWFARLERVLILDI